MSAIANRVDVAPEHALDRCVTASYTRHGRERVLGRLSLSPREVADMLDWDLAVNIGTDGGKVHRLFYSVPDKACFVAIQDPADGAIITVLPLDFYENLAWPVSRNAQDKARWLVSPRATRKPLKRTATAPTSHDPMIDPMIDPQPE